MASFPGVDFIEFDSLLNDEEKLVRQTARQFVDNEVLPIIAKHNREATFPTRPRGSLWTTKCCPSSPSTTAKRLFRCT